ncbi:MAG TPA: tRNA (adenosine(37)-N6)-threonylcarbamoyltransferase complex ATPase subunit type 1 TsaE [Spirochaetota bacterium]|mgnify:FL=1|jgi:tRNA threonylcarbamoyladenosine biosynthesis protein TsaE|nr:tRNA (adenosine(37)-N6)-threonylcarbamoyltransferase complex ATPase subunit type 1 TsaE [Spirochaetota bacterium]HOR93039.1 tRNA (adenosine(37)-N6)-threonylcarbamoyltransferase complex ATPase subunit type 1 TsaE [Spirochaetota bacterium]HOT19731.1 tRNA (adenosine(37)-N6)-threonylcarbamoyltransferase complex ATPase subunit type 1 TsaE [Spirochaetota bacterium]HPD05648.1 tRNA (adenosine(37)-N6)-threonylcarbamoyltransferase complex ATPase subunit type 1 TsaE [Spirochaetota bacterium]HQI38097.1 
MKQVHYTTSSQEETFAVGYELGKKAKKGDIFCLIGDLGTGKTILAKGIAKGLGINEEITSPTFTLLEVYEAAIPLYHFDLYRISDDSELENLFFEEYWYGDGVSVIEWAERAMKRLSNDIFIIRLSYTGKNRRKITIEHPDP